MFQDQRRQVLKTALAAASVAAAPAGWLLSETTGAEPYDVTQQPIIDTHQHLWDLQRFKPPWLAAAPDVLRQQHTSEEYRQATDGLPIERAVYMEIDVAPQQQAEEAEFISELCRSAATPTVAAVISGRPGEAGFRAYFEPFRQSPYIKGVRQVLHGNTPQGYCLNETFVASIRYLGELGMSFDLCLRPTELADGRELVARCPGTRFIVDHCGNADPMAFVSPALQADTPPSHQPEQWRRDMARLAECEQVVCKISGIVARAPQDRWTAEHLAPIVKECLALFGPDRVMFGSDWPVCRLRASYRQWVTALRTITADRPTSEQRRLWHDNAARFYGLAAST